LFEDIFNAHKAAFAQAINRLSLFRCEVLWLRSLWWGNGAVLTLAKEREVNCHLLIVC